MGTSEAVASDRLVARSDVGSRGWSITWQAVILASAGIGAAALILWLGHGLTFFFDEWQYLEHRDLSLVGLLWPHNEHWVTLHVLLYKSLAAIFGTGSYLPWQVVLVILHLVIAAGLYRLLERVRPGWFAVAGTVVFLFLGTGADNLLWGFQIGFDLAMAFGIWALVIVRERPLLATWLILGAVMSQGIGLIFAVACVAASPRSARWLWMPVAVYAVWFVTWGTLAPHAPLRPADALPFMARSLTASTEHVTGLPGILVVLAVAAAIIVSRSRDPFVRAAVFGLLAEFALIGFARAELVAGRYVYLAVPFMLIAASSVRLRRADWLVGLAVFGIVLATNVPWLAITRDYLGRLENAESFVPVELRGTTADWPLLMEHYQP